MAGVKRSIHTDSETPAALSKELDDVSCPICMDHPHNAVLLLCSSHDKGCRSYVCDTSYRHSNCLDRLKKLRDGTRDSPPPSRSLPVTQYSSNSSSNRDLASNTNLNDGIANENINNRNDPVISIPNSSRIYLEAQEELDVNNLSEPNKNLKCPMCRGAVLGWEVVEEARKYLNLKKRSCSREACSFVGNYEELRRHARRVHPTTRPTEVDPSRERAWQRFERQREVGDILSAIRSAIPDAVVVGDYVVENGDRFGGERRNGSGSGGEVDNGPNGPLWTTFFLFQMIGSVGRGAGEARPRSRTWVRRQRREAPERRRYVWGQNLLGLQDEEVEEDFCLFDEMGGGDESTVSRRQRQRRRLTRSRFD